MWHEESNWIGLHEKSESCGLHLSEQVYVAYIGTLIGTTKGEILVSGKNGRNQVVGNHSWM